MRRGQVQNTVVYSEPAPVLVGQEAGDEEGEVEALPTMDKPMSGKVQVRGGANMPIISQMVGSVQMYSQGSTAMKK